jgi:hypothetical protein
VEQEQGGRPERGAGAGWADLNGRVARLMDSHVAWAGSDVHCHLGIGLH